MSQRMLDAFLSKARKKWIEERSGTIIALASTLYSEDGKEVGVWRSGIDINDVRQREEGRKMGGRRRGTDTDDVRQSTAIDMMLPKTPQLNHSCAPECMHATHYRLRRRRQWQGVDQRRKRHVF